MRSAKYQGVYVVSSLVCIDGLQVGDMVHDVKFLMDAVAAVRVASHTGDIECLATGVPLDQADSLPL